jgi:hypothetical protein
VSTDETGPKKNGSSTASNGRELQTPVPLDRLRAQVPKGKTEIELEGSEQTFSSVLGTEIGIGQKDAPQSHAFSDKIDPYQWFERTSLPPDEIKVFVDMKQMAEHGIGGDALDIPIPEIGEMLIDELRARRSRTDGQVGQSSSRFEAEMTAWLQKLKAEAEERARTAQKGVGA